MTVQYETRYIGKYKNDKESKLEPLVYFVKNESLNLFPGCCGKMMKICWLAIKTTYLQ